MQNTIRLIEKLIPSSPDFFKVWIDKSNVYGTVDSVSKRLPAKAPIIATVAIMEASKKLQLNDQILCEYIENHCKRALTNVNRRGLPWDAFGSGHELSKVFATGRVLLDLKNNIEIVKNNLLTRATKYLSEWLSTLPNLSPLHLPLVYRAALSLGSNLNDSIRSKVGAYGQGLIHYYVASNSLGSKSQVDRNLLCLAILLDAELNPNPITERERKTALELALSYDEPLISLSRTTSLLAGTDAIGLSSLEVLRYLLEHSSTKNLMWAYKSQIDETIRWLDEHSVNFSINDGNVVRLFQNDVFAGRQQYYAWHNSLAVQFLYAAKTFYLLQFQQELAIKFHAVKPETKIQYSNLICGGYPWPQKLKEHFLSKVSTSGMTTKESGNGIVLFGPPGTGKTTIAQLIAAELGGWNFVKLSTADFLLNGYDRVISSIKEIFSQVRQLNQCVILFDELELLVLERANGDWNTGLITNVMLPELQELHDCTNIVPIFATNYISKFDKAGRRPGRFDYVLPVGLPDSRERHSILINHLSSAKTFDGIEDIPERATIREIFDFIREYQINPSSGPKVAKRVWANLSRSLRIDDDTAKVFAKEINDFTYPSNWI